MLTKKAIHFLIGLLVLIILSPMSLALNQSSFNHLVKQGIHPKALKLAVKAYDWANQRGVVKKPIMTLVNFDLKSNHKRLWIINMKSGEVLFNGLVANGSGSGLYKGKRFSNTNGSRMSSLGAYVTKKTYYGHHGLSLRLNGLERGINNHALSRDIVVHPAKYVTPYFANHFHRVGRSWGCFAVNPKYSKKIINMIEGGSFIFAYAPQEENDPNFS